MSETPSGASRRRYVAARLVMYTTLRLAMRTSVWSLGAIILLAILATAGDPSPGSHRGEDPPIMVRVDGDQYHVSTRIPDGKKTTYLHIYAPEGNKTLTLSFDESKSNYTLMNIKNKKAGWEIGSSIKDGEEGKAWIRSATESYLFSARPDGKTDVRVLPGLSQDKAEGDPERE